MTKKIILGIVVLFAHKAIAQQLQPDWIGPFIFAPNTSICDNEPYKLVFFDDFNGNAIDTNKWITFNSWNWMTKHYSPTDSVIQDHDDWTDAYIASSTAKTLYKNENVVVSNGTVKLQNWHEPVTWKCPSCPNSETYSRKYSSAVLATYFVKNGNRKYFDNGRFEYKAKMPGFTNAYGTAWTWFGSGMGVNELDLAESSGPDWSGNPSNVMFKWRNWKRYATFVSHPTHAWGRKQKEEQSGFPVPYHEKKNVVRQNYYPRQTWAHYKSNTFLNITDWHTYATEWDSTEIRTFLDGELFDVLPKYYRDREIRFTRLGQSYKVREYPDLCNISGEYNVTEGFPYSIRSNSQLRFTTGVNDRIVIDPSNNKYFLGQMELDYVKIWQRQPQPNYTEICKPVGVPSNGFFLPPLFVYGPSSICDAGTFFVPVNYPGGTWSTDNSGLLLTSTSNNNTTANFEVNPNSNATSVILTYSYPISSPGCPPVATVQYNVQIVSKYKPVVTCVRNGSFRSQNFSLAVMNPMPNVQYEWFVDFGLFSPNENYHHAFGSSTITQNINHYLLPNFVVKWKLKVTVPGCAPRIYEGLRDMIKYHTISLSLPETYMAPDSSAYYFEARMNEEDSVKFQEMVYDLVSNKYVKNVEDSAEIETIIADAHLFCIEEFLHFAESEELMLPSSYKIPFKNIDNEVKTIAYPNPNEGDVINLNLSNLFDLERKENEVTYRIYSSIGKLHDQGTLSLDFKIKIRDFNPGIYIIELKQGNITESVKFQKM